MYKFIYKSEKPPMVNVGGYIGVVFGLIVLLENPIFGLAIVLAAVAAILYQSGIEVDFENKKYRLGTYFGPLDFGSWENIPPLKYVSVFKANMVTVATRYATGGSVNPSKEVIQVNLITEQNRRINIFQTKDVKQAFDLASKYASQLGLDVWDATTKEGKWM